VKQFVQLSMYCRTFSRCWTNARSFNLLLAFLHSSRPHR